MSAPNLDRLEKRAERLVDDREQLMETLIAIRKEHKLTQKDVAERMGVTQPTVAAFEHYDSNPTLSTIHRYAMAVEAMLRTIVVDDCERSVPSEWSVRHEPRVNAPIRAIVPKRGKAIVQNSAYAHA
ncbi:helix-turn-helix domain-containing protein [Brachybacterium kimchii]|uniref:Helix-turn-helix domain-containing protein n=1 Tax=Brachybacterium kimchii TaxID=2942909 RepID=A0ABY4NB32_9MICO|nr:helix-turn-helix transcriptional regulator [Brachybacterium kimchii]UQN30638.1 helix-turn-helix domain-containing protein [Brachybacterium kimchii]